MIQDLLCALRELLRSGETRCGECHRMRRDVSPHERLVVHGAHEVFDMIECCPACQEAFEKRQRAAWTLWAHRFQECPVCHQSTADVELRHRHTAYCEQHDKSNWMTSCLECYESDCAFMNEQWADYNGGRI